MKKIAYFTGDIAPNGHFSFFHDLLCNYPKDPNWFHRIYLVGANWDYGLLQHLKDRYLDVRPCFRDFQPSVDHWWKLLKEDTADCDVIISGNITNLDEVIPDDIDKPVVSVSLAEQGYITSGGTYGSNYKPRFIKTAVSNTAKLAFPEHVRDQVTAIHSGIDISRITPHIQRHEVRETWFPTRADDVKVLLFTGTHQESKGLHRAIQVMDELPEEWQLIVLTPMKSLRNIPEHLQKRIHLCPPTYYVGDIYQAVDCLLLPTEHEGFSMSLLEAWYLETPTVTTKHKTILELQEKHPTTDFGQLIELDADAKETALAIRCCYKSESANELVLKNYTAQHMVERWQNFLESL